MVSKWVIIFVVYLLLDGVVQCIGVLELGLDELVLVDATTQADEVRHRLLWVHHLNCLCTVSK